jgi:hypothetical protein
MMNKELYFLPIIARAFGSKNLKKSLEDAFAEIKRLGLNKKFIQGRSQFEIFMEEAGRFYELLKHDGIRRFIAELATEDFQEDHGENHKLFKIMASNRQFHAEYKLMSLEADKDAEKSLIPVLRLFRDGNLIGKAVFSEESTIKSFTDIVPGNYQLRLNTGMEIWQVILTPVDLIWEYAFPGEKLELAAETEMTRKKPTKEIFSPYGEVKTRVYAGIESGTMEIELAR